MSADVPQNGHDISCPYKGEWIGVAGVGLHCWRVALGTDCVKTMLGTGTRLLSLDRIGNFDWVGWIAEGTAFRP